MTNLLQITEFHTSQAIKTVEIVSRLIKGGEKCIFATPTKQRRTALNSQRRMKYEPQHITGRAEI